MARTKLTPEMALEIFDLISQGHTAKDAALLADIGERTYYRWLENGEKAKSGIYSEFLSGIKKALLLAKEEHIKNIVRAGKREWQASAWYLERRYPDEYGKREKHEVQTNVRSDEGLVLVLQGAKEIAPDEVAG